MLPAVATPAKSKEKIEAIERWMRKNGAPRLADNLARGASAAAIGAAEKKAGVAFPAALRDLYRLHDGQPEELDCFVENLNLLSMAAAAHARETFLRRYVQGRYGVLRCREEAEAWTPTSLLDAEISERWWPLARMDGDFLVTNLDSGRVFWAAKDVPPLKLAAESLPEFFATYLRRLEAGDYALEDGFGEYYLAPKKPWPTPAAPAAAKRTRKPPETIAEETCDDVLGDNLFFLFDDLELAGGRATLKVAFHCPSAWVARLREHPIVTEPLKRLEAAIARAMPMPTKIVLEHVDVGLDSLRLYVRRAGPSGAQLLREIGER
jgi:cell wall assembly regulator SMI1